MGPMRSTFLEGAAVARDLVATREVGRRWDAPSALPEMSVGLLCGHMTRVVASPVIYLEGPEPEEPPVSAARYYASILPSSAIDHPVNVQVRERSVPYSEGGQAATIARLDDALAAAEQSLETEPDDRKVRVFGDVVLRLDDYLATRIVELVVHCDDVAFSVDLETPRLPPEAIQVAIDHMVAVARLRHGDTAVVRALSRRERDHIHALRVF